MDVRQAMEKAEESLTTTPEPSSPPETSTPEVVSTETTPAVEAKPDRLRAEDGKFVKPSAAPKAKPTQDPSAKVEGVNGATPPTSPEGQGKEAATDSPPAAASTPVVKAPVSWTPAEREVWSKLPAEAQRAVERREREIQRALTETTQARQVAQRVQQTLAPYETLARTAGMDSVQYAGTVLQTAAALQMGTPAQKAAVVAQILGTYGVDVDMVNQHLQGQAPQQAAPQRPQVDPREEIRRVLHEEAQQAAVSRASQALQSFMETQPEFIDTVWDDMQAILEAASRSQNPRLRNMTFEDAYSRACSMHPEISQVMEQRKAAQAVRTPQRVTDQARAAASSIRSQPAAPPAGKVKGIRGAVEAAAEKLGL